jgi:CubicO group peptidase (beta-lactamase class C family)
LALSRRELFRTGGWLGLGAGLAAVPWGRAIAAPAPSAWPMVAAMLDRYVDGGKLAGAVAALGFGEAGPQFISRGRQSLDQTAPMGPDSLFRDYSMTKPITGMAAMMLIDEGKMALDQPLADILPGFAHMKVQVTPDGSITDLRPATRPITLRMLLTHTAGLGYTIIQKGPIKTAYEAAKLVPGQVTRLPIPGIGGLDIQPTLAAFADKLAEMPLVYEPGTQWSYSVGLDLMGRVIEVVSGQPFEAFLRDRIFAPCGMTSSFFQVPGDEVGRLTTNYAVRDGTLFPLDPAKTSIYLDRPPFAFGGAGLVSSARDYDRFLEMLLGYGAIGKTRVMSEKAVRLGTSNLLPPGAAIKGTWIEGAGFGAGGRVGLGDQAGTFGWDGAAGTIAFADFRHRLRASLFVQIMPSDVYPLLKEFTEAVRGDLIPATMKAAA